MNASELHRQVKAVPDILFKNATVIDPEQETEKQADVLVRDGKLQEVGSVAAASFQGEVVDATGKILCPGFIDLHVHLREPGREDEETVVSGAAAAMAGGFVSVCPMPNTDPPMDNAEVVRFVKQQAEPLLVDVFPIAAVTKNRAGEELAEMGEVVEAGAVAFSDDGDPVATAEILRRAMEYTRMFDVPIIEHCEDKTLTVGGAMHEGAVSTRLGLPGIPGISEDIIVARDILVAEFTGARLHIAHISTAGAVELVRQAKKRGVRVTCEVTPHHFTLDHEAVRDYDPNTKMNPPLRTRQDVEAMLEGLQDGTIDVIATDHAPHSIEEKETEYEVAPFGIIGLETALGLILTQLVDQNVLSLPQAVRKITANPAQVLGVPRGRLAVGEPASLTLFDPKAKWTVDRERFYSKSKNSPFHGWELRGKVFGLYNRGRWWPAAPTQR